MNTLFRLVWPLSFVMLLSGCMFAPGSRPDSNAVFQSFETPSAPTAPADSEAAVTQRELRERIMRFGLNYGETVGLQFGPLLQESESPQHRATALSQMSAIGRSLLLITTGQHPEANLLDLVVLVTLLRMTYEAYWVPEFYGVTAQPLLQAMQHGEQRVWTMAESVLTPEQRRQLRELIAQWRRDHPDQISVEGVRLADFATESREAVDAVLPRGLLPEVSDATRALDEALVFAERLTSYLHVLPRVYSIEIRSLLYDVLAEPESRQLLANMATFSAAAESLSTTAAALKDRVSEERSAAINELMDRVSAERAAAIDQIHAKLSSEREETLTQIFTNIENSHIDLRSLVADVQNTLTAGQSMAVSAENALKTFDALSAKMGWDQVDERGEPVNLAEYRALVTAVRDAAGSINMTLESMNDLLTRSDTAAARLTDLIEAADKRVQKWLLLAFGLGVGSVLVVKGVTALVVMLSRGKRHPPTDQR